MQFFKARLKELERDLAKAIESTDLVALNKKRAWNALDQIILNCEIIGDEERAKKAKLAIQQRFGKDRF